MTADELLCFVKGYVFVTLDGSPALARLNVESEAGSFFLEKLPFPHRCRRPSE